MVRPNRTASNTSRSLRISALAAGIMMAIGGAHAQVRVEAQSENIRGRAPVVTIAPVENQSVAGQAPAVGHVLHADANVVDPDGDAITGTTYRWRRGAAEVGTGQDYATTAADAGATLTLDVTATTDPAITDPDVGTATVDVSVSANTAPFVVANSARIEGTYAVGETLTGSYDYSDAEGDLEDPDGVVFQWQVSHLTTGSPVNVPGATGRTYVIRPEDQGANRRIWFSVEKVRSLTGTPNERNRPTSPAGQWQASRSGIITGTAPTANPTITGTVATGQTLTATVGFNDVDGDTEGTHQYQWYRADNAAGTVGRVAVGNGQTYTVQQATDQGKYFVVEITPRSSLGASGAKVTAVTSKETRYRLTGEWEVTSFAGVTLPITISNRTGNAPSNLKVGLWRSYKGDDVMYGSQIVLIAPDGTRYALGEGPLESSAKFWTVNVSSEAANGTWRLELGPSNTYRAYYNHFTLEFTP